jgi:ParB family chromosome partitioning protein
MSSIEVAANEAPTLISLSKLVISEDNVRRTDRRADIEALAEDIAAHGVLQNLCVTEADRGRYAVSAGGRRHAALKLLLKQGRITSSYAVPCRIVATEAAVEASLAENIQRVAMNAMDEAEAFAVLRARGLGVEDIAQRYGAKTRHVEQRLALAALPAAIRDGYRRAEISLDAARAFCVSDDSQAQMRLYKQMAKPIHSAHAVRHALNEGRANARDKLARFVGVKAYEAAGGRIVEDLFEPDALWLEDGDVLARLAGEKLDALRERVAAEGWAWVDAELSASAANHYAAERLRAKARKFNARERKAQEKRQAAIEAIDTELEVNEDNDALWDKRANLQAEIEAAHAACLSYDKAHMSHAGARIVVDRDGSVAIARGLIKRADLKAIQKLQRAGAGADAGAESDDEAGASQGAGLSRALVERLTLARTRAIRARLTARPALALSLIVAALEHAAQGAGQMPGVSLASRPISFDGDGDDAQSEARDCSDILKDFFSMDTGPLLFRLAAHVSRLINFVHQGVGTSDARVQALADALARALELDMAANWRADEDFWMSAPKSLALTALGQCKAVAAKPQAERDAMCAAFAKMKKAELARHAAELCGETGWLPELLITPRADVAQAPAPAV